VDQDGRVVYVGTLSKSLSPSLRLGFLVAPPTLRHAVVTLKQLGDPGGDTAAQRALAQLIQDGRFGAHLRRSAKVYGARRKALISSLEARLQDLLTPISGAAGLHLTARLSGNTSIQALDAAVARAAADGVAVRPLHRFAHTSPERQLGLVLGYGLIPEDRINDGVERVSAALRRA
jgi:GntR family transcriptional regulator/MocR family aminotransferase